MRYRHLNLEERERLCEKKTTVRRAPQTGKKPQPNN